MNSPTPAQNSTTGEKHLPFLINLMRRILGINALLKHQSDSFETLRERLDSLDTEAEKLRQSVSHLTRASQKNGFDRALVPLNLTSSASELPPDILPLPPVDADAGHGWTTATFPAQSMQHDLAVRLVGPVLASRGFAPPNAPLALVVPPDLADACSEEEFEQLFGILGAYHTGLTSKTGQRILLGTTRPEVGCILLRWSPAALRRVKEGVPPDVMTRDRHLCLAKAIHGLMLPDELPHEDWAADAASVIELVASETETATFALVNTPGMLGDDETTVAPAIATLREMLARRGFRLAAQWCTGAVTIEHSAAIAAFAKRHGLLADFTPIGRGEALTHLSAYDGSVPYRPMGFDIRIPSFDPQADGPIIVPRHNARDIVLAHSLSGRPGESFLAAAFDGPAERLANRLAAVLDRAIRTQYQERANSNAEDMVYWPMLSVYNWAPPATIKLHALEFDAEDLFVARSPLSDAIRTGLLDLSDPRLTDGKRFLAAAENGARNPETATTSLLGDQVRQHEYLSAREITADTRRLIDWLPAELGDTLEIGSGYGVLARELISRTSLFVGCDLTIHQAQSINSAGGVGLICDIHDLPFLSQRFDTILADNVIEHAYDPLTCLKELRRVLKPGGHAFLIIPMDYLSNEYQNRAHLWKADERSVRAALSAANLRLERAETLLLSELGVPGAFPSCRGRSSLWDVVRD